MRSLNYKKHNLLQMREECTYLKCFLKQILAAGLTLSSARMALLMASL
jgi:hypothetical protein